MASGLIELVSWEDDGRRAMVRTYLRYRAIVVEPLAQAPPLRLCVMVEQAYGPPLRRLL